MRLISLLVFLAVVVGGGAATGLLTGPDEWYAGLRKPSFNPPSFVFAPVWTILYVLVAVAGWRIWHGARGGLAMMLWFLQLVLNFLWSPAFFVVHRVDVALAIIIALLFSIAGFVFAAWKKDRLAAVLFLPYMAWVSFAAILNASLLALN